MKKIIIAIICVMMLAACSSPKETWDTIKDKYIEIESEVKIKANSLSTIIKEDYQKLLADLSENINNISFKSIKENDELLKKIYKGASYLESLAALFNGEASKELLTLSKSVKLLCEYAYDGSEEDFEDAKIDIMSQINNINTWANEKWATVEKKDIIDWNDIKDEYDLLEEEIDDSIKPKEVTEIDLDDLKHDILDNYQEIETGITSENEEYAKQIYIAAYKLSLYTNRINDEKAKTVNEFANATMIFVKENYLNNDVEETIDNSTYKQYIEDASKWTQSTWNEITKYLKIN